MCLPLSHLHRARWDERFIDAASAGRLSELRHAVANGASVDTVGGRESRMTAAHWACQDDRVEVLRYLVSETACTLNALDSDRYAPLHIAVEKGHVECVRVLVESARPAGAPRYTPR